MKTELDFLRSLEQSLQLLYERVRRGYSGVPEVTALKAEVNQRLIQLLERAVTIEMDDDNGN